MRIIGIAAEFHRLAGLILDYKIGRAASRYAIREDSHERIKLGTIFCLVFSVRLVINDNQTLTLKTKAVADIEVYTTDKAVLDFGARATGNGREPV